MFDAANGLVAQASGYSLLYMYEYFLLCPLPSFFRSATAYSSRRGVLWDLCFGKKKEQQHHGHKGIGGNDKGWVVGKQTLVFVCFAWYFGTREKNKMAAAAKRQREGYLREKIAVVVGVT